MRARACEPLCLFLYNFMVFFLFTFFSLLYPAPPLRTRRDVVAPPSPRSAVSPLCLRSQVSCASDTTRW